MSTKLYSDKKLSGGTRPRWWALGKDANGVWHNVDARTGTIVGVHESTGQVVARERYPTIREWVRSVDDCIGWADHPDADPRRNWLEDATDR